MAYRTVVVTVPRQNGKTSLLWALLAWWSLAHQKHNIVATAQTGTEAYEKWRDYVALVSTQPATANHVADVRYANGSEMLTWTTGTRHRVRAPTARAGHGLTLDLALIDEAWALRDEAVLQSFRPAMVTRPDAQLWIVSTAGTLDSVLLRRHVELGRQAAAAQSRSGVAYFEWSAPDDVDADDPRALRLAMPALGLTITEEVATADRATMTRGEYERAYLNRWTDALETVIPLNLWALVLEPEATPEVPVWLAFDVSPERDYGAIVAAGWWANRVAVEVVDHRVGVEWMVPRLNELLGRHEVTGLVMDGTGPGASLADDLNETPVAMKYAEVQRACGSFFDSITSQTLAVRPHEGLTGAVRAAARIGAGDTWRWGRRRSAGDITTLMAATMAYAQARGGRTPGAFRVW